MSSEIHEFKTHLAGTPAWLWFRDSPEAAAERGTILFWHGLGVSKEVGAKELGSLARQGYLAVGLDNAGHGERRLPDFEARLSGDPHSVESNFLRMVVDTANETPRVVDELERRGWLRQGRLGASGISMGGFVTYLALLRERRIRAAAPILGSPRWRLPWQESPHQFLPQFFPTAILSQCAGQDLSVPPWPAREFHQELSPHYQAAPERQRYVEFEGVGHFMPEPDWTRLWSNVLEWFGRFLD